MNGRTDGQMGEREGERASCTPTTSDGTKLSKTGHSLGALDLACTRLGRPVLNVVMHLVLMSMMQFQKFKIAV